MGASGGDGSSVQIAYVIEIFDLADFLTAARRTAHATPASG